MKVSVSVRKLHSISWCDHFLRNRLAANDLAWDDSYRLSARESAAISASIQQFQLGEGSSGKRLLARGAEFAAHTGDLRFLSALRLFVREEQRHSRYLARFMRQQDICRTANHWVDRAFRGFRHLAGLELSLRVLCTAEIIAVPYYRALAVATKSPLLRAICLRILSDEADHLRYQSWMMAKLNRQRPITLQRVFETIHQFFLFGTCCIVWREHGRVFRAARYSFSKFVSESFVEFAGLHLANRETQDQRLLEMESSVSRSHNSQEKSY